MSSSAVPSQSRVILTTGANRGIGLAIIQNLATDPRSSSSTFLLGCRDISKGESAIAQLRSLGITSTIHPIHIDVTSDSSLRNALQTVREKYGRLDVLINNAGQAILTSVEDFSDYRHAFGTTYDTNVISVALSMQLFLPLLRKTSGTVINVSSGRASITKSATGQMPPTVSIAYSISKTALNALTVEMGRYEQNKDVSFYLISPGHCKTEFNGFRGLRDPLEGANVVVELVCAEKNFYKTGKNYETRGDSRELIEVPW
jgi:NAD(P)-dependent dehydrogenase (short-subunit alcohol dehydrogenase family)